MRWGRVVFEGLLIVALAVACFCLYVENTRIKSPFLPHLTFSHDNDSLSVTGTWRREDGDDAYPSQTTTIDCERATRRCTEASAVLARSDLLMPIVIHTFDITQWNDSVIIARGSTALCVDETYEFHLTTKAVTGLILRKRNDPCHSAPGVAQSTNPVRMRMVDGYEEGWAARGFTRTTAR